MKRVATFPFLFLLASGLLRAQAETDVQKRLKTDEDRISALESEIKALKAALTAATSAAAPAQPAAPVPGTAPAASAQAPAQVPAQAPGQPGSQPPAADRKSVV